MHFFMTLDNCQIFYTMARSSDLVRNFVQLGFKKNYKLKIHTIIYSTTTILIIVDNIYASQRVFMFLKLYLYNSFIVNTYFR